MLKEICLFWENQLKTLGEGGKGFESEYKQVDCSLYPELASVQAGTLVIPNGWSPEHGPRGEDGVAHDQQILSELFLHTIEAARILGEDLEWANQLEKKRNRLYPPQIGKKGNLMEWMIDRNPETDHRHTSHLFQFSTVVTISLEKTPQLRSGPANLCCGERMQETVGGHGLGPGGLCFGLDYVTGKKRMP